MFYYYHYYIVCWVLNRTPVPKFYVLSPRSQGERLPSVSTGGRGEVAVGESEKPTGSVETVSQAVIIVC